MPKVVFYDNETEYGDEYEYSTPLLAQAAAVDRLREEARHLLSLMYDRTARAVKAEDWSEALKCNGVIPVIISHMATCGQTFAQGRKVDLYDDLGLKYTFSVKAD